MRLMNLPPILRGTEQDQISALRNYLVDLVREINDLSRQIEDLTKKENNDGK